TLPRQRQNERSPRPLCFDVDLTFQNLNILPAKSQTEAGARGTCGEERIEDFVENAWLDARPGVLKRNRREDLIVAERNFKPSRGIHRLCRVQNDVDKDSFDDRRVGFDTTQLTVVLENLNSLQTRIPHKCSQCTLDHITQLNSSLLRRHRLRILEKVPDGRVEP